MPPNALTDAAARQTLHAQARRALFSSGPVPSPCVSVCQMDPTHGICAGCLRTLVEIADWGRMDSQARLAVWQRIVVRSQPEG
jgi:predicted Fe-S protein YdhL (DUF1289 family)